MKDMPSPGSDPTIFGDNLNASLRVSPGSDPTIFGDNLNASLRVSPGSDPTIFGDNLNVSLRVSPGSDPTIFGDNLNVSLRVSPGSDHALLDHIPFIKDMLIGRLLFLYEMWLDLYSDWKLRTIFKKVIFLFEL
jgi:hypothetical protein